MNFYLAERRISKNKAIELFGKDRFNQMLADATETHSEDPFILNSWFSEYGMFSIKF